MKNLFIISKNCLRQLLILISRSFFLILLAVPIALAQSPYKINFVTDSVLLLSGAGSLAMGYTLTENITPFTEAEVNKLSKDDINGFDRWAWSNWSSNSAALSDVFLYHNLVLPAVLLISKKVRGDIGSIGLMYLETLALTSAGSILSKGISHRTRPFAYNPEVPLEIKTRDSHARKSFYSGHTTLAFSSAVFFSKVYSDYFPDSKWRKFIWSSTLGVAGLVGYFRVDAGKHFPTDVLAGAVMGSLTGYFVPALHKNNRKNVSMILPSLGTNQLQVAILFQF